MPCRTPSPDPSHAPRPRRMPFAAWSAALTAILMAACSTPSAPPVATPAPAPTPAPVVKPLVIGHRGASALRPEHTLAAYAKAIDDGADVIEPDLVMTKDGVLVARHENEISGTTNVADLPQFAARKKTKVIDGERLTGWFTEDFTLAELKTLRARERIAQQRPNNVRYNDQYPIPTFDEIVALAASASTRARRTIHLYPEIKHASYFRAIGLPMEDVLLTRLKAAPYTSKQATVYIQSFETANLRTLRGKLGADSGNIKLIQLLGGPKQRPADLQLAGDTRTYADLTTPIGLREIATYANGIGPPKSSVIPVVAGRLGEPTPLVARAHEAGLLVHPYTFRPENAFLPADLKAPGGEAVRSEAGAVAEMRAFMRAGVDGLFTDDPALGRKAVDAPQ